MRKPDSAFSRFYGASQITRDAAFALALMFVDLFVYSDVARPGVSLEQNLLALALAAVDWALLVVRRRWPGIVCGVLWVQVLVTDLYFVRTGFRYDPVVAQLSATYTVAACCRARVAWPALLCLLLFSSQAFNLLVTTYPPETLRSAVFYVALDVEVWSLGRWANFSRLAADRGRRRVAEAQETVLTERARTARELHDVVANAVTVMVLQAAGARRLTGAGPGPDLVGDTLARIEDLGKTAIDELRHMLLVLRADDRRPEADHSFGIADLDPLLDAVHHAGLLVHLTVEGVPARLDKDVDLTAYRLVQEALTNSVKHSGPGAAATVRLTWSEHLRIEVTDNGRGTPVSPCSALSTGHGLLGMHERVALSGGSLTAGPTPAGGFAVSATLPVNPAPAAPPRPRLSVEGIPEP